MLISHWCKLIEGLQGSPLDFYKCVEEAIDRRQVPGLKRTHVLWPEGGLLSANRDYLRLTREKLLFDICAAPFGTGFFVSCRVVDNEFPWYLLLLAILLVMFTFVMFWLLIILATKGILAVFASIFVLVPTFVVGAIAVWIVQRFFRGVLWNLDHALLNAPLLGPKYERLTRRNTYYRIDLILMFQAAVQAAVLEVVDKHIKTQNLTPLSEFERKPVLSKLLMR